MSLTKDKYRFIELRVIWDGYDGRKLALVPNNIIHSDFNWSWMNLTKNHQRRIIERIINRDIESVSRMDHVLKSQNLIDKMGYTFVPKYTAVPEERSAESEWYRIHHTQDITDTRADILLDYIDLK